MVTAAFIGTGANPEERTADGFSMAYRHADAYKKVEDVEIVACADIVPENAAAFAETYGVPDSHVFEDYTTMLADISPDIVSVTVPPAIHADIVVGCAESGEVDAVHCEKPMALTWPDAKRMADACDDADVQLTFNHQRRFGKPFREAKRLIDEGVVGDLQRIEVAWGDLFDTGSHTVDLCGYFNDEIKAEWVIAQLDYRDEQVYFGVHTENQTFAQWRYENGVYGVLSSGAGDDFIDAMFRIQGTDGEIKIGRDDGPVLSYKQGADTEWTAVDCGNATIHGPDFQDRAIADVVDALHTGRQSELRAENALKSAAVLFAGYESVRRRGRVDLDPDDVTDHPLQSMVEAGELLSD